MPPYSRESYERQERSKILYEVYSRMLKLSLLMLWARRDCTSEYAAARVEVCMGILTFAAAVVDWYIFAQCYTAPS